ncbi:MAG: helix-turn-helix domain-containing protein [Fimbriiglobus sp.]
MKTEDIEISVRGAGQLLRRLRLAKGFTSRDFAMKAGVNPSIISKIENNTLGLTTSTLKKVAPVLDMTPVVLAYACLKEVQNAELGFLDSP